MKTVRAHLSELHVNAAAHHVNAGKCCKALAAHHTALASHFEITDPAASTLHKSLAAEHEAMAAHHGTAGETHVQCCKDLAESEKSLGNEMVPTRVSPNPTQPAPNTRPTLVPRTGQNVPATDPAAVQKVDGTLQHLVRSDDDN